jgi:hypothetical protein
VGACRDKRIWWHGLTSNLCVSAPETLALTVARNDDSRSAIEHVIFSEVIHNSVALDAKLKNMGQLLSLVVDSI